MNLILGRVRVRIRYSRVALKHIILERTHFNLIGWPIFILFFLSHAFANAQGKQTLIWNIGDKRLDFHTSPPTLTSLDSPFFGYENTLALCDEDGNYQMFVNSKDGVYNKKNQLINGTDSIGVSIIIPKPSQQDIVYFFRSATGSYSSVDFAKNSIVDQDVLSVYPSKVAYAVHHANCRDIWYIGQTKDCLYSYLITPQGVSSNAITSLIPSVADVRGCFSPNGRMFVFPASHPGGSVSSTDTLAVVFGGFDRASGKALSPKKISFFKGGTVLATAFSADETKLYIYILCFNFPRYHGVLQIDVVDGQLDDKNVKTIYSTPFAGGAMDLSSMQLGLDGKIYHVSYFRPKISIINHPERDGVDCDYQDNAIPLSLVRAETPRFVDTWFSKGCSSIDIAYQDNCLGLASYFSAVGGSSWNSYFWDFGDGQTSTLASPSHTYSATGTYTVSLTATNSSGQTQKVSKTVSVYARPTAPVIKISGGR